MRLNKYIALAGAASRRKADELTKSGNVKINGVVMKEPGYDVKEGDLIEVNGVAIKPAVSKVYLMINKPKGYITSVKDEKDRPVVTELITDV
jgi:23S rRNA pseudouridine2605 synthase